MPQVRAISTSSAPPRVTFVDTHYLPLQGFVLSDSGTELPGFRFVFGFSRKFQVPRVKRRARIVLLVTLAAQLWSGLFSSATEFVS